MSSEKRIPVAVLGATGSVGQRFIQLLENHPWFEVAELVASDRSAGKTFADATEWRMSANMPEGVRNLVVKVLLRARLRAAARLLGHEGSADPY